MTDASTRPPAGRPVRRSRRPAVAAAAALVLVAGAAAATWVVTGGGASSAAAGAAPACGGSSPRVTVQGSGVATGTPDRLTVAVDVSVTGPTANAALHDDNAATGLVVAAFEAGGVPARDVQTTGLSVQPNYQQVDGVTTIVGYNVDNTADARLTDFATAGSVVDSVVGAGGDAVRIDSLDFSLADPRHLEDVARGDAVHQAASHAASMAAGAGEHLAGVCSITDDASPSYGNSPSFGQAAAAPHDSAVPLGPGTEQESAQVTLVYALAPGLPRR